MLGAHNSILLAKLHWILVCFQTDLKCRHFAFKSLNGFAHVFLADLLSPYVPSRSLRSANQHLLTVHPFGCKSQGGRGF